MKHSLFIIILLLFCCAACRESAPPEAAGTPPPIVVRPSPSTQINVPVIVAFGDSLTAGYGLLRQQSYPSLLQEKLRADGYEYRVVNEGVTGDTSAAALQRLDRALESNVKSSLSNWEVMTFFGVSLSLRLKRTSAKSLSA